MLIVNSRNSGRPFRGINNNNDMMMIMIIIIIITITTTTTKIIIAMWSWALNFISYVGQKNTVEN